MLKELADEITRRIQGQFGYQIPVVLRTAAELHEAVISNPLMALPPNEKAHHVMFLAAVPDAEKAMQLEPDRSPGDEFLLRGRDVYLYLRNGAAKTKLTNAWFDRKLGTVSTARNWRTVLKLQELLIKNERGRQVHRLSRAIAARANWALPRLGPINNSGIPTKSHWHPWQSLGE